MNKTKGLIIGAVEIISLCAVIILSLIFFPSAIIKRNSNENVNKNVITLEIGDFELEGLTLRDATVLTTILDESTMTMKFEEPLLFDAVVIDVKEMSVESTICKVWCSSKDQSDEGKCVITNLKSGINVIPFHERMERVEEICINIAEKEGVIININSLRLEVKTDEKP